MSDSDARDPDARDSARDPDSRDSDAPDPGTEAPTGRRRFLKRAGAAVALLPVAAAVQAAVAAAETSPAKRPRARSRPAPAARPAADPYVAARPDTSITRTADERASLERQWKGMVEVVKMIREAPLDPATEPATIFAALPRRGRDRGD